MILVSRSDGSRNRPLLSGTGRDVRVAVFAAGPAADEARAAGADIVGADDLAEQIEAGKMDFDLTIATPT